MAASDSDDGYGDSSDIMYDAEEENETVGPTQMTRLTSKSEKVEIKETQVSNKHIPNSIPPSVIFQTNNENGSEDINYKKNSSVVHQNAVPTTSPLNKLKDNDVVEGTKPILKQEVPIEPQQVIEDENLQHDDIDSPEIIEDESIPEKKAILNFEAFNTISTVAETLNRKEEEETRLFAKSNGRFSKSYKKPDLENLDSDIDDDLDEFNQNFFFRRDSDEILTRGKSPVEIEDPGAVSGSKAKHKSGLNTSIGISKDKNNVKVKVDVNQSLSLSRSRKESPSPLLNNNQNDKKLVNLLNNKQIKNSSKLLSSSKNSVKKDNRLSSSQPIPNIKSTLMTPSTYQPLKSITKGVPNTSTIRSRSRTVNTSSTKTPLSNHIQSTRSPTLSRKSTGAPPLSKKLSEKKPLKAIHSQTLVPKPKVSLPNFDFQLPKSIAYGVRKSASTSDLRRQVIIHNLIH